MKKPDLTICALLQGNNPALAIRCADSLLRWPVDVVEVRIGLDAVDPATNAYVNSLVKAGRIPKRQVYISTSPLGYYPMMRRMLYDPGQPIATKYVAWVDADACIMSAAWLPSTLKQLTWLTPGTDVLGDCRETLLAGNQPLWIADQPWYTGKAIGQRFRCFYPTYRYWAADYSKLSKYDWPPPDLDQADTDVMLGMLCFQQDLALSKFTEHVTLTHSLPVRWRMRLGFDYDPGAARQLHVQQPPPRPTSRAYLRLDL